MYMHRFCTFLILLTALLISPPVLSAAQPLKVGVYECPPFVIKNDDNTYFGLSIRLWQQIAENKKLNYSISEYSLDDLISGVGDGTIDVGVSCLSITPDRETMVDFSHSFFETHLSIAVKKQGLLASILNIFKNKKLLIFLAIGCGSACVIGGIFYLLEHKINEKLYSTESTGRKLTEGFILGLLFITKGPFNYYEFRTLSGRVIAVCLAVLTTFFLASFTAILASSFTLGLLGKEITSINDLVNKRVGAKVHTTASELLDGSGVIHRKFETTEELIAALENNAVEAIVADDAVLRFLIKNGKEAGKYNNLHVLPYRFEKQNYGFALKEDSPYLEELNREMLKIRKSTKWRQALLHYLNIQ